jgi:hypothetical protein
MSTDGLPICSECGGRAAAGQECVADFHQFQYWEAEDPATLSVHHLMVLSYHLQHPSRYSPEALSGAISMLDDFLVRGVSPAQMRREIRRKVDSSKRVGKIAGTPELHGEYGVVIPWRMTAGDVVSAGIANYVESIQCWANSIHASLRAAHILP